jgi:hypothetical protein
MSETKFIGPLIGGIREDIEPFLVPLNSAVSIQNFDLSSKHMQKSLGDRQLGSNLAAIAMGVIQFTTFDGALHTVVVTEDNIYAWDGATTQDWVSIMGTEWSCTFSTRPHFAVINNVLIATNHADTMQVWDGVTETMMDIAEGSPTYHPKALDTFKDHLLMLGGAEGAVEVPQRVRWPAVGTYNGFDTPGYGYMDLLDTPGIILAGKRYSQFYIIYKSDSISVMQYIGGDSVFSANTIISGIGIAAENALIEVNGQHWFLGSDGGGYLDIFSFSGSNVLERVGRPVYDTLKRISKDYVSRSFAVKYGTKCIFAVPIDSEYPDTWLVYDEYAKSWSIESRTAVCCSNHLYSQTLTIGDLTGTIGDLQGLIGELGDFAKASQLMLGTSEGDIYHIDPQFTSMRGSAIESSYESGDIIFLDPKGNWETYRVEGFDFYCQGAGDLYLQYSLDSGETWVTPVVSYLSVSNARTWLRFDIDVTTNTIRFKLSHTGGSLQIQSASIRRVPEVVTVL